VPTGGLLFVLMSLKYYYHAFDDYPGYGDVTPTTNAGIVFTMFFCVFGCSYMAKALAEFVQFPILQRLKTNELRVLEQFTGDMDKETLRGILGSEFLNRIPGLVRTRGC
jgi:Ion channel